MKGTFRASVAGFGTACFLLAAYITYAAYGFAALLAASASLSLVVWVAATAIYLRHYQAYKGGVN